MTPLPDQRARNVFGALAFFVTAAVIGVILSPVVAESKEAIANVILGNVLAWPAIVLSYHFGTSQSSVEKNNVIAGLAADSTTVKPVEVVNRPSDPVQVELPEGGRHV